LDSLSGFDCCFIRNVQFCKAGNVASLAFQLTLNPEMIAQALNTYR
jgi:hypothetical protein